MPDEGMATNKLPISNRPVDEYVRGCEIKYTSCSLATLPLHRIFGSELAKVGNNNFVIGRYAQGIGVCACTLKTLRLRNSGRWNAHTQYCFPAATNRPCKPVPAGDGIYVTVGD